MSGVEEDEEPKTFDLDDAEALRQHAAAGYGGGLFSDYGRWAVTPEFVPSEIWNRN